MQLRKQAMSLVSYCSNRYVFSRMFKLNLEFTLLQNPEDVVHLRLDPGIK